MTVLPAASVARLAALMAALKRVVPLLLRARLPRAIRLPTAPFKVILPVPAFRVRFSVPFVPSILPPKIILPFSALVSSVKLPPREILLACCKSTIDALMSPPRVVCPVVLTVREDKGAISPTVAREILPLPASSVRVKPAPLTALPSKRIVPLLPDVAIATLPPKVMPPVA